MTSVPKVFPGDTVFWHGDLIHSVEKDHTGNCDSAGTLFQPLLVLYGLKAPSPSPVMYIPAVPTTPLNQAYVERQKETFLKAVAPPDFPVQTKHENSLVGFGKADDILNPLGRKAMGLPVSVA